MAVRIVLQFVQMPLLLTLWGVERYGEWLLISAFIVYLNLSGGGVSAVAGNITSAALVRGDVAAARSIFRAAWVLITLSNAVLMALAVLLLWVAHATDAIAFRTITPGEGSTTILLVVLLVALKLQGGFLGEVIVRSRGRYGEGLLAETLVQIVEFVVLIACVAAFQSTVAAAAGLVAVRALTLGAWLAYLFLCDRALLGKGDAPLLRTMRQLIGPSAALLLFPVAQAIQFEGVTLAIGYWLGPAFVVAYVTMRTLARLSDMPLLMGFNLIMVEGAYLKGGCRDKQYAPMLGAATILFGAAGIILMLSAWLGGYLFYGLWTAGRLGFDTLLFFAVVGVSAARSIYLPASAMLVSQSEHMHLSIVYVGAAIFSLLAALLAGHLSAGLHLMAASSILCELVVGAFALVLAMRRAGVPLRCVLVKGWEQIREFRKPFLSRIVAAKGVLGDFGNHR